MLTRCILWVFIVFSFFLAATTAYAASAPVGTIVEVEGSATLTRGGNVYEAGIDTEVYLDDVISTGSKSRVFVLLIDDTEWILSENTKFKVTDFVFDPDNNTGNQARYSVLEGAFRYVSGLVAKKDKPDVDIKTPVGSIGIRGTDFIGGPEEGGGYGVYVNQGSVNVENAAGETLLRYGEGVVVRDRRTAPGRAQKWQDDRIRRLQERVRLKRQDTVRQRQAAMQGRQMQMREKYRATIRERLEKMKKDREDNGRNTQERIQQKREGQREQFQDRIQQRRQQNMRRQRYNQ